MVAVGTSRVSLCLLLYHRSNGGGGHIKVQSRWLSYRRLRLSEWQADIHPHACSAL